MIKQIAVIPNLTKENSIEHIIKTVEILNRNNIKALVEPDVAKHVENATAAEYAEICAADMIVTLGGDGTLLSAVHKYNSAKCPFLGINYGHLGFLTEIEKESYADFEKIIKGDYTVSKHLTIETSLNGVSYTSLNDTAIHRDAMSSMVKLSVSVDGEMLYTLRADGLIISTPTGSTAYSLSAGGPIVDPTVDVIILTLICPHDLNSRSILVPKDKEIHINIIEAAGNAVVNFDGNHALRVNSGDVLAVTAGKKINLVRTSECSFYKRLKEKLF